MNDQNDWYNVLGSGEPYQFEPPVLEEESYASKDSFDGLKRERMIHFLYQWLLWKRRYIIEINMFRNSFRKFCDLLPLPYAVSLFGFCCVRTYVEIRFECGCKCRMVSLFRVRYLHSCTARCDVMFLSIPFYKTKVIIILVFWCNCVRKTVYLWPFNYAHLVREHLMP